MNQTLKVLTVFGTRPEAIKLAPLLLMMAKQPERFESISCATGQHDQMLRQALKPFGIQPDYDLGLMRDNQGLGELTARLIVAIEQVISEVKPALVMVQGDTTTTFCAALAAFYAQLPVAHVEAGLRSNDPLSPFPEEVNRVLTDRLSAFFFAPTEVNRTNLLREGVAADRITVTGNTSIDALQIMSAIGAGLSSDTWDSCWGAAKQAIANREQPLILVTAHRRESFGAKFEAICGAIRDLANKHPNWNFVYPVHLNPQVQRVVTNALSGVDNVFLIEPLEYEPFVYLMNRARLIMTDSGGIQEEAPSIGKPVVVLRDKTERVEAVEAGTAILVGTDRERIKNAVEELMSDDRLYDSIAARENPYGDGHASERILDVLFSQLCADAELIAAG